MNTISGASAPSKALQANPSHFASVIANQTGDEEKKTETKPKGGTIIVAGNGIIILPEISPTKILVGVIKTASEAAQTVRSWLPF